MFKEELEIDGVLCWRNIPNGRWNQYSLKALTRMLNEAKTAHNSDYVKCEHNYQRGEYAWECTKCGHQL